MVHFATRVNFQSRDSLHIFVQRRTKEVDWKMIHQTRNRGHWTCEIVKSRKSYCNGHLPYLGSFYYLPRVCQCMSWHVNLCTRKDTQNQLTQTSLKCYYDQIFDTHFFTFSYTIGLSIISCQIWIYYEQYNPCFLDLSFREFTAAINFPCSKSGLRIGENDITFSKIPHGFKL